MGQKVSPIGLRVGVIRDYINNKFKRASVSRVEIERAKNRVKPHFMTIRIPRGEDVALATQTN